MPSRLASEAALSTANRFGPAPLTTGPRQAFQEAWISIDFHGVLDCCGAGDAESQGIHPTNVAALRNFLERTVDRGFRVGVASYIGRKGSKSASRREDLENAIRWFNEGASDPRKKLGLKIVDFPAAKTQFLQSPRVANHLDDRLDLLWQCWEVGIPGVRITFSARFGAGLTGQRGIARREVRALLARAVEHRKRSG